MINQKQLLGSLLLFVILAFGLSGCYSFKGIDIGSEVKTFTVYYFENSSNNVVPNLSDRMVDELRRKVANNTRLKHVAEGGDVEFYGTILKYDLLTVAPKENETTTFGRLEISVNLEYLNHKNEDKGWTSRFTEFSDYPSDADFSNVENGLIDDINELLIQDMFDKAFTNW